jgi:hypothetical protein
MAYNNHVQLSTSIGADLSPGPDGSIGLRSD